MDRLKRNSIIDLLDKLLSETAYSCLEVEWDQVDRALIVYIEGPESVVMDDCLAVNKILSESEDVDNLVNGPFRLEISSPGVERPLRTKTHFEDVVGQVVNITATEKVSGRKKGKGLLKEVSQEGELVIDIDSNEWRCPIVLLNRANLVYDWS